MKRKIRYTLLEKVTANSIMFLVINVFVLLQENAYQRGCVAIQVDIGGYSSFW